MPDRPPFPIPENLTPETCCLCIPMPQDETWKTVIAGLLFQPAEWFNWQRDDDRSGRELAQYWRNIYNNIDWSTMSCCCPETAIPLSRYTSDGHYQTSGDNGVTWSDDAEHDPRRPVTQFPPFLPPETVSEKCTYADSVVQIIKTQIVDLLDDAGNWQSVINVIASALVAVFGVLAPTVVGALVVAILGGIVVAIIGISIPAFKAAMTTDVYDRLRCNLQTNIGSDGSFNQERVDAVYNRIATDETGMALLFLQGVVAAAGWQGLTNMARSGYGAADADCTECPAGCIPDDWRTGLYYDGSWHDARGGTIVEVGEDYLIVESQDRGDGQQEIAINVSDRVTCCLVRHEAVGTPSDSILKWSTPCPAAADLANWVRNDLMPSENCITSYYFQLNPGTWQIKFTFVPSDDCP